MYEDLFCSLYSQGVPFALIDTRERRDYVNSHWFGSTNFPLSTLNRKLRFLIPDVHFPIQFLDWQTEASRCAYETLRGLGYNNLTRHVTYAPQNFGSGFVQGEYVWSKAFGEVLANLVEFQEVEAADYIIEAERWSLFDVRPTTEYRAFTLPTSQSLPNSMLLGNLTRLLSSKTLPLFHCAGRTRSIIGACTLLAAGYEGPFAVFKGGTQAWELVGQTREFAANRVFSIQSETDGSCLWHLNKWKLPFTVTALKDHEAFMAQRKGQLMFDVSDDSATGTMLGSLIIKISGTNLIQQTDQLIARYHVKVVLFDTGSGSRAAFAGFWLRLMGFSIEIILLKRPLEDIFPDVDKYKDATTHGAGSAKFEADCTILDFRSSQDFENCHIRKACWTNISQFLDRPQAKNAITIIGYNRQHLDFLKLILKPKGWTVTNALIWQPSHFKKEDLINDTIEDPIDQSNFFAKRHQGNLQDSQGYLSWEESLPDQINPLIKDKFIKALSYYF